MPELTQAPKQLLLFFDVETSGLPSDWKAPLTKWPRLVQLAWAIYDMNGNFLESDSSLVIPKGFTIPKEVSEIHGITTEKAAREGKPIEPLMAHFYQKVKSCSTLVGHNVIFDTKIIGGEFLRLNLPKIIPARKRICTMLSSVNFCKIPSRSGYKWPKLIELHNKLFGCDFEGAHDASFDIAATAKCFWELKRRGVITL